MDLARARFVGRTLCDVRRFRILLDQRPSLLSELFVGKQRRQVRHQVRIDDDAFGATSEQLGIDPRDSPGGAMQ